MAATANGGSGGTRSLALLVAATFFMENLDGTVIATALPRMAETFRVSAVDLNIGLSAYLLTLAVFIPASGWAADRWGARTVFAAAIAGFTAASMLCGAADGLAAFVAARVLQGVAGALMVPVGRLVVLRSTPKAQLVTAIATITWPGLVAPLLGPPAGGFITTALGWRWIFFLNLPLGALALWAALRLVPDLRAAERRRFDWPGFALGGGGLLGILTAVELAGHAAAGPDGDWMPVAWCGLAGLVLAGLALRHFRRAAAPMLELDALDVPTFAVAFHGGSLFRMAIGAVPFLLPLLFQAGWGLDAFQSGLLLLATSAGTLCMKPLTTSVLRRWGFRPVLVCSGVLTALTLLLCVALAPGTPTFLVVALLFAGGLARSMQFTAYNTIAFADVAPGAMSGANTLFSTALQLSLGLGVAVGALAVRLGAALAPWFGAMPAASFRLSFVVVAAVALAAVADALALDRRAGNHVVRPAAAAAPGA